MIWDGIERRQKVQDHDTLVEVVQILKNHVDNFNMHRNEFVKHREEDGVNFKRIDKTIYLATGVVTAVIFVVRIIFK